MKWKRYLITFAIVLLLGLMLVALLALFNRHNQTVGFNQEIQYDDFAFSVLSARKANTLGLPLSEQNGDSEFYVVTMKIANHARRVNFTFKKAAATLVDERGNEYHFDEAAQKAFDAQPPARVGCESDIAPGADCLTEVVFRLPASVKISHLRISEGGALGDLADAIFYGKKIIKIKE